MKKNKPKFVDDGRTIANMNIDGMPWYNPAKSGTPADSESSGTVKVGDDLTLKEKMAMTKGVLLAGLLVGGVFALAFTVFILLCIFAWS